MNVEIQFLNGNTFVTESVLKNLKSVIPILNVNWV